MLLIQANLGIYDLFPKFQGVGVAGESQQGQRMAPAFRFAPHARVVMVLHNGHFSDKSLLARPGQAGVVRIYQVA